jgi:hypothetical protein
LPVLQAGRLRYYGGASEPEIWECAVMSPHSKAGATFVMAENFLQNWHKANNHAYETE